MRRTACLAAALTAFFALATAASADQDFPDSDGDAGQGTDIL